MSNVYKKVGGVWTPQSWKEVWKKTSGVWNKLYNNKTPLYTAGVQNVPWTFFTSWDGTVTYNTDNVYLFAAGYHSDDGEVSAEPHFYTTNKVDFTPYSKLYIDHSGSIINGSVGIYVRSVSPYSGTTVASLVKNATFGRTNEYIDVSSLSGSYYVDIGVYSPGSGSNVSTNVYNVWFE